MNFRRPWAHQQQERPRLREHHPPARLNRIADLSKNIALITVLTFIPLSLTLSHPAFATDVDATTIDSTQTPRDAEKNNHQESKLISIISILLILQTLLVLGLQKSRIKYKRAKKELKSSHQNLEERVIERTNSLKNLNDQLYEEISKHEITEELLRQTQDYLQSLINSMSSILIGVTKEGVITHWNTSAATTTGKSEDDALGKSIEALFPHKAITLSTIREAIEQGKPRVIENIQDGIGSESNYHDIAIYPLISDELSGAVIRVDDVTMRIKLENMMIQNEKMMSLGELAAGLAHEINNPLGAILQGIQNIQRRTSPDLPANLETAETLNTDIGTIRSYLDERKIFKFIGSIQEAGERAAKIVANMLEFSRSSNREYNLIDLESLVEQSLELAGSTFEFKSEFQFEEIQIIKDFADDMPPTPCSAIEMQQVLLNLLRNASQALALETPPINNPTITITLGQTEDATIITVADNGPGMDESISSHIFEPFYTTKEVGQGTGLGLSVSYFIVTEHHEGTIEVDSAPGRGTKFTISLPRLPEDELDPFA